MRLLALLALTGALALSGCGGGGDESTTAGSEATVAQAPGESTSGQEPQAGEKDDGSPASGQNSGSSEAPGASEDSKPSAEPKGTHPYAQPAPGTPGHPTPHTKAPAPGVPVTSGGDNSIQTFGEEGQDSQRQQAEANLKSYLAARVRGDWPAACQAASAQFSEELEKLIEGAKAKQGAEKPEGCAETLELLYGKTPASAFQKAAQVDQVLSFRVRDDGYAYLIFESAGEIKFIAMANEGGAWKVNVPEPASFQASQGEAQ